MGALINAVFLYAQCFAIFLQAVKRFLVIEKIEDPKMLLIVGGLGLFINLVGMLIFGHDHSHHSHQAVDIESEHGEIAEPSPAEPSVGEDLNIQGVFLHVMADALGSVVVMVSASVIWLTDWKYRDYLDPLLSLVIVLLVSLSSWPLLKQSVLILLNSIPGLHQKNTTHGNSQDLSKYLFLCLEHIDAEALKAGLVSSVSAIRNVHELHIWELVGRLENQKSDLKKSFSYKRRIIATGHVEAEAGGLSTASHRVLGRDIKQYFHRLGIHSSTVQIEYSKDTEEGCRLECPPSEVTGIRMPQCNLHTCCLKNK